MSDPTFRDATCPDSDATPVVRGTQGFDLSVAVNGMERDHHLVRDNMPACAFLRLDLPILDQIASYLDFNSALTLSTVCKRVRNAAERELWRRVNIFQPLDP